MSVDLSHLSDDQLNTLGVLERIAGEAAGGREAVLGLGAGARDYKRLSWGGTGQQAYDGFSFGRPCQGWLIINDGATDAYLSLSDDRSNAAGSLVTVPAGSWMALPLVSSKIVLGSAGSGTALVFALEHAPAPACGAFETGSYAKGKVPGLNGATVAASGFVNGTLVTAGYRRLLLMFRMTGSATGDLTLTVAPYEDDGVTVGAGAGAHLAEVRHSTQALSGGVIYVTYEFDLYGADLLLIGVANGNAAAQTATVVYYLEK